MDIVLRQFVRGQSLTVSTTSEIWLALQRLAAIYACRCPILRAGERQKVSRVEARQIACALKKSLDDLPNFDAILGLHGDGHSTHEVSFGSTRNRIELFSGENKTFVRTMIAFCQRGGFEIKIQDEAETQPRMTVRMPLPTSLWPWIAVLSCPFCRRCIFPSDVKNFELERIEDPSSGSKGIIDILCPKCGIPSRVELQLPFRIDETDW